MNKRSARVESTENARTIGDLRALIGLARGRGGMSRVNPIIPLERVLDIYEAAIAGRPADEVPSGTTFDPYRQRPRASGDSLIIRNILRDCA